MGGSKYTRAESAQPPSQKIAMLYPAANGGACLRALARCTPIKLLGKSFAFVGGPSNKHWMIGALGQESWLVVAYLARRASVGALVCGLHQAPATSC